MGSNEVLCTLHSTNWITFAASKNYKGDAFRKFNELKKPQRMKKNLISVLEQNKKGRKYSIVCLKQVFPFWAAPQPPHCLCTNGNISPLVTPGSCSVHLSPEKFSDFKRLGVRVNLSSTWLCFTLSHQILSVSLSTSSPPSKCRPLILPQQVPRGHCPSKFVHSCSLQSVVPLFSCASLPPVHTHPAFGKHLANAHRRCSLQPHSRLHCQSLTELSKSLTLFSDS